MSPANGERTQPDRHPTRREILKRGAIAGAGLWLAPAIHSFAATPAHAASNQPCAQGTYGFRLNNNGSCVVIPVGNPTSCLNMPAPNGCPFIVAVDQSNPLAWSVTVVGVVTNTALQCNGFRSHPCNQGSPDGFGIDATDNGNGTTTVTFDCRIADPHVSPHNISHIEILFTC